jgi:hypothetical protein
MTICCPFTATPGSPFASPITGSFLVFDLEGVPPGTQISVIKIDHESGERQGVIATTTAGAEG